MNASWDENVKNKLIPKDPIVPHIYRLPKIHKEGVPLRPIVNMIGPPTYKLARLLASKLEILVGQIDLFDLLFILPNMLSH
jgi:hypothetical protein